jgi:CheY-like chemotaxis protein
MPQRVLIVEDNVDVRDILCWRLSRAGFYASAVADGRAGLAAVRAAPWDLVLLDLMMPEMDGFEFLAALRSEPRVPPVVVITQYDDVAILQRAIALGAASYVGKSSALERSFPGTLSRWVASAQVTTNAAD